MTFGAQSILLGKRVTDTRDANGVTIPWIAEYFASSEEFDLRYGDLDDREFVALVYRNVMNREPDQGGYGYWLLRPVLEGRGNGRRRVA